MKIFRALCALFLFVFPAVVHAQLTQITGSGFRIGGNLIPAGTVCAVAVDVNNNPVSVAIGGGGMRGVGQSCANIAAGVITTGVIGGGTYQLPDEALAGNPGFFYNFTITDTQRGSPTFNQSFQLIKVPNITGSSFALDHYFPTITVPTTATFTFTTGSGAPSGACSGKAFYQNIVTPSSPVLYQCGSDLAWHIIAGSGGGASIAHTTNVLKGDNAGNGVAATPGTDYAVPSSCPLKNATNICITDAPYNAVGNGTTDNTAAFLAAIAAIAALPGKTGTIWVPDTTGSYVLGTTLLDTGCANAVLPMPKIANYGANTIVDVSIKGFSLPSWNTSPSGAVIKSALTTGKLIGGCDSDAGGGFPNFTNVKLEMENLTISLPANTGAVAIDASNLLAFQGRHLLIVASGTTAAPTTSGGIFMPQIGNEIQNELDDTDVAGFYTGYKLTEHTHAGRIYVAFSSNCLVFDAGSTTHSTGPYTGNGVRIDYVHEQDCVNNIVSVAGAYRNVATIGLADFENTTGNGVLDASNNLYAILNINITNAATSTTTACNANVSGGSHTTIHYLLCQPETSVVAGPPSGLIENWTSQDGSGTTLANTGTDSTNSMTTNATWATATGFTGNVATYNGTSSFSVAASAANTNFDGSSPFSVCLWFNSNGIQSAVARVITTVDGTSSAVTGWDVFINPSGGTQFLNVLLFNNFTTNNYVDFTGSANVTANTTHLVCFKYDGTKSATSVKAYLDGAPTTGTETSTLTGSIANGNPVMIGAALAGAGHGNFFHGAIGRARIFNRLLSDSEISTMFSAGPNAY